MSVRRPGAWLDHREKLTVAGLLLLSAWCSTLRWGKMSSFWGDGPRSLFEAYRVFSGDIPYRDVASLYPPLATYVFALFYKLFGQTFVTSGILLDLLSACLVLSTFYLVRQFLPWLLSTAIAVCLLFAGVTGGSAFALFSLDMYSPSALIGAIGLNLFLLGLIAILRTGIRSPGLWLASAGANMAIFSRAELMITVFVCLALTGLHLWSARRPGSGLVPAAKLLAVGLLMLLPAGLAYSWLIAAAGFRDVIAGLVNYGSAKLACPYWPTGLGLLGFSAGLGQVVLVYIFGIFLLRKADRTPKYALFGGAFLAALVVAAYLYVAWDDFPRFWALAGPRAHASLRQGIVGVLALSHLLVPVMSATVVLALASSWRFARALFITPEAILYIAGATLCIRSLFGSLLTELPTISSSTYPILFVIAGILLSKAFALPSADAAGMRFAIAKAIPSAVFLVYGFTRIASFLATGVPYYALQTAAGRILLEDPDSVAVYNYVVAQSGPEDYLADIAFDSGGVNFSARRHAPLFMTLFAFQAPYEKYLERDQDRIRTTKPTLVIGNANDHLGTVYGGELVNGCPFPALVWRSGRLAGDPARVLPVVSAVKENYTPIFRAGNFEVLKRNDLLH